MHSKKNLCILAIFLTVLIQYSPALLSSHTYFQGDLTYLTHPWRTLTAEMLQRGELPLWNPYAYFGIPLAANLQSGVYYPPSLLFALFPFASALKLYHLLHYFLGGFFAFLWMRSWGFPRSGSLAASFPFYLGGFLWTRLEFPNHLGALIWLPLLLLFFRKGAGGGPGLTLSLTLSLLAGYPQTTLGALPFLWLLQLLFRKAKRSLREELQLLPCITLGILAGAVLLAPAGELFLRSQRHLQGLPGSVITAHSLVPADFLGLFSPWFQQEVPYWKARLFWGKTLYLGILPTFLAGLGFLYLRRIQKIAALLYLALTALLLLGNSTPLSDALWRHLPPLSWIRYPANWGYLLAPCAMLLIGSAARHLPRAVRWMLLAIPLELLLYGYGHQKTIPSDYFPEKGSLVRFLQSRQGSHRIFHTPQAEAVSTAYGPTEEQAFRNFKKLLPGMTGAPYHLSTAGGIGEPLIPYLSENTQELLKSRSSLRELAPLLPKTDISLVLAPYPPSAELRAPAGAPEGPSVLAPSATQTSKLSYLGRRGGWHLYAPPTPPARAYWSRAEFEAIQPLHFVQKTESHLLFQGAAPEEGWVTISQTFYPGWKIYVNGKEREIQKSALGFPQVPVEVGPIQIQMRYEPLSFLVGLAITAATLLGILIPGLLQKY
ncbi:MAG: YfhO family protein [Elusimicrobia bacterium]|nr:YfhO family protein [Elusimicrobiota bacterium]